MLAALLLNPRGPLQKPGGGGGGVPNPRGGSVFSPDIPEEDDRILMRVIAQFLEGQS
jgi:hypothetical protein